MTESSLKITLISALKKQIPDAVVFRHEDQYRAGIPDMSVTWRGRTSWWEVKFLNPKLVSRTQQELTMKMLDGQGFARYIVYSRRRGDEMTAIVLPRFLGHSTLRWYAGINHEFVIDYIRQVHSGVGETLEGVTMPKVN